MTNKQLLKAIQTIVNKCQKHKRCDDCILFRQSKDKTFGYCMIDDTPYFWDIEKIEDLLNG